MQQKDEYSILILKISTFLICLHIKKIIVTEKLTLCLYTLYTRCIYTRCMYKVNTVYI